MTERPRQISLGLSAAGMEVQECPEKEQWGAGGPAWGSMPWGTRRDEGQGRGKPAAIGEFSCGEIVPVWFRLEASYGCAEVAPVAVELR